MNRIRKFGDKYQVLITPALINNAGFESLIDNWYDATFRTFSIEEYELLNDAQTRALQFPDLNWYKLMTIHVENFKKLKTEIKKVLDDHGYIVEFHATLQSPEMLKENMFDRVANMGRRFTLVLAYNDIITFDIISPYGSVLQSVSDICQREKCLRIIFEKPMREGDYVRYLVGKTQIGTCYEIRLFPTLFYNFAKWIQQNGKLNKHAIEFEYKKVQNKQKLLDEEDAPLAMYQNDSLLS